MRHAQDSTVRTCTLEQCAGNFLKGLSDILYINMHRSQKDCGTCIQKHVSVQITRQGTKTCFKCVWRGECKILCVWRGEGKILRDGGGADVRVGGKPPIWYGFLCES